MPRFEDSALCRDVQAFHLPRFDELPQFRLYIDQLIQLVEGMLAPLKGKADERWLTHTMVGNYLKQGVVPRPEGKRYGPEHAAYLLFICLTKQVMSIGDIQALIGVQQSTFGIRTAYDYFCTELENILAHVFGGAALPPDSARTNAQETRVLRSACFAVAYKCYLALYLRYIHQDGAE